jgi:Flp pilus assembly protein TadB
MVATGVGVGVLTLTFLGIPSVAIAIGILASAIPAAAEVGRRSQQREDLAGAWPDFLALMRGRVVAGETLPDAFVAAAERSPEPLRSSANQITEAVSFGDGFAAALERLRDQLDDATADRVLATIAAAHRSGGPRVGLVLTSLGASVADELRLRRSHIAALTEQRMTALVALIAPWALLALTISTNPQSALSYRRPTGTLIVAVGLVATSLGYLTARRTAALSRAPRVFE